MADTERDGRAERGEATRAALIEAARELFSERGYAAVGTSELVRHAGVTRGAMYHHFPDKRELFRAVYEQTEKELVEGLAARIATIEDPWEALVAGMRSFFDVSSEVRAAPNEDPDLRARYSGVPRSPARCATPDSSTLEASNVFAALASRSMAS